MSVRRKSLFAAALFILGAGVFIALRGWRPSVQPPDGGASFLRAPEGFSVSVFADGLEKPRVVVFDPKGRMLVSEMSAGRVTMLTDADGDGRSEMKTSVLEGLNNPHGLAFYTDPATKRAYLYVAETHRVARYPYDTTTGRVTDTNGQNIIAIPGPAGRHVTRTIAFGPNLYPKEKVATAGMLKPTQLYVSVGSSCDTCIENSWKRAAILQSDPEGTYTTDLASGLRNAVFLTFHPTTRQIWATEMGRDNLGDDLPPDEVNVVSGIGNYGWPFCYGARVRDITFQPGTVDRTDIPTDCAKTLSPRIEIPAHSAPLGLAFIPASWPSEWRNHLLVAYHGSWNRSVPTGYKVVRFGLDGRGTTIGGVHEFLTGFLEGGTVRGRPVDLKFDAAGALYISDDAAGRIYRVVPNR